jgi:16S rRNA processing protein RimM
LNTGKIACGKFLKPFGLGGELKFKPYYPEYMDVSAITGGLVRHEPGKAIPDGEIMLISARPLNGGIWAVRPDGCNSPESARRFTNAELLISRDLVPKRPDGEYLPDDVINLPVYDDKGVKIGVVQDVYKTGANDVWELVADNGREIMIPVIKDVVLSVGSDKIIINVIPGLLD